MYEYAVLQGEDVNSVIFDAGRGYEGVDGHLAVLLNDLDADGWEPVAMSRDAQERLVVLLRRPKSGVSP